MMSYEINRYIYEEIMDGCRGYDLETSTDCHCPIHRVPDYCSNEQPRALLDEVAAKLVGSGYGDAYITALADAHSIDTKRWSNAYDGWQRVSFSQADAFLIAHSTALQIATAIVQAHKDGQAK